MKPLDAPPPPPPRANQSGSSTRRATPVEQALVDRFKAALAGKDGSQDAAQGLTDEDAMPGLSEQEASHEREPTVLTNSSATPPSDDGTVDLDTLPPVTVGALAASSPAHASVAAAASGGGGAAYNAAAVAQLLEKHVRQLLVSESRSARGDVPQVMLNLTDAVLPGTQLTLTQTDGGWKLASSSTSTDSYRIIRELAPQLQARFDERGLGDLDLQVSLAEEP